jgi:predicted SprT family Zn-dependent metalloprotease
MKKKIIKNSDEFTQEDEMEDLIFQCSQCGEQTLDEENFNICCSCNNYVCSKCSIDIEHQGFQETVCCDACK